MKRKLIRVGTSAAVLIPKATLEELNVDIGDEVYVQMAKQPMNIEKKLVDPSIIEWTDEFIEEYKPMLKKLASS